jgi:alpha,alpha-trehalase
MKLWIALLLTNYCVYANDLPPPCSSEIYCYGRLIESVAQTRIFKDSKEFVDLKLKKPPNDTLILFNSFISKYNDSQPPSNELKAWLDDNFDGVGSELIQWYPTDFNQYPKVLDKIKDKKYKQFALDLNNIWLELCRKMKNEVKVIAINISQQFCLSKLIKF